MNNRAPENCLEEKAKEAIDIIIAHPFTLLSLSDREKFHTGFLAYVINNNEFGLCVAKKIFSKSNTLPERDKQIKALVEYESIDLLLCRCDEFGKEACGTLSKPCEPKKNAIAPAEVKLKTDLHSNQLEKYKQKFPKEIRENLPFYLISLFPTTESISDKVQAFDLCDIPDILPECIPDLYTQKDDTRTLCSLWCTYLIALKAIREYFVAQKLQKINLRIVNGLRSIKLLGIFQRYRLSLISPKPQGFEAKIDNTKGAALLDVFIQDTEYKVGLQWQGLNLKLFIAGNTMGDEKRDKLLKELAKKLEIKTESRRDGIFRSINWANDWDIMGNISGREEELEQKFKSVHSAWKEVRQTSIC